jgi:hypothetical protein
LREKGRKIINKIFLLKAFLSEGTNLSTALEQSRTSAIVEQFRLDLMHFKHFPLHILCSLFSAQKWL